MDYDRILAIIIALIDDIQKSLSGHYEALFADGIKILNELYPVGLIMVNY